MDVAHVVRELGGVARSGVLAAAVPRPALRRALDAGSVVRLAHGLYGLPEVNSHRADALGLDAALALESAALAHGWGVKIPPTRAQVVVQRGRKMTARRRRDVDLRWGEVSRAELDAGVTSKVRTAVDCARVLPFDAALAVVDSALRDGVSRTDLLLACDRAPRTGRSRAFRVIELGTRLAANPFESVLRAVVHTVPGADFEPQVWIGSIGRTDLADRGHRVVLEADSFEFHCQPGPFADDMVRYNAFVAEGWLVLRFAWKHVMFEQDAIRATVAAVLGPSRPAVRPCPRCTRA